MKFCVLMCDKDKNFLFKTKAKILDYINEAEKIGTHNNKSVISRELWYDLSASVTIGDFIFPSMFSDKCFTIDNRKTKSSCDCVCYDLIIRPQYKQYSDVIFLLLNTITFRFFLDLFGRQMAGSLSDVDTVLLRKILIPNPELFSGSQKVVESLINQLKIREPMNIFKEIKTKERQDIESFIFDKVGIGSNNVQELFDYTANYILQRNTKTQSVATSKTKGKLSYEDSLKLVKERFPEVRNLLEMVEGIAVKKYIIPEWKAKFPKQDKGGTGEMFSHYRVYFKQGDTQKTLDFENESQLILFEWLYETLDLKGLEVYLPTDAKKCQEILPALKFDFVNYFPQIRSQLKTSRSSANPLQVYRELVLG